MSLSIARAGRFVIDLIYPPACALCGRSGAFLCRGCEAELPRADGDRCTRCWLPLYNGPCRSCQESLPAFGALRSRYRYGGQVHDLVHALKFKHQSSLAAPLGAEVASLIEEHGLDADALVPVPLRTLRERHRGYNQASLLAREAGSLLGMRVLGALERRGTAEAQARALDAAQRRRNVQGAFNLRRPQDVSGLALLLVDDVATTGATLDACAQALFEAGAASVSAVTLARED